MHLNSKKNCHQLIRDNKSIQQTFIFRCPKIEENLIKSKHQQSKDFKNLNGNFFFITPTNHEEAVSEKKNLKGNKSPGSTIIPIKFLKSFQTALNKQTSLIANLPTSTETFPADLKTANVLPVFQKIEQISNNYRVILLPANISKIIDKLIHSHSMTFLSANKIL